MNYVDIFKRKPEAVRFCFETKDYGMARCNETIPGVAPTYEYFKTLSSMTCLVSPLGVVQSTGHITKTVAYDKWCCKNLLSVRKPFHNTTGQFCSKYIDIMWFCLSSRLHAVDKFCEEIRHQYEIWLTISWLLTNFPYRCCGTSNQCSFYLWRTDMCTLEHSRANWGSTKLCLVWTLINLLKPGQWPHEMQWSTSGSELMFWLGL